MIEQDCQHLGLCIAPFGTRRNRYGDEIAAKEHAGNIAQAEQCLRQWRGLGSMFVAGEFARPLFAITISPGRNFSVAGLGVFSVSMNMHLHLGQAGHKGQERRRAEFVQGEYVYFGANCAVAASIHTNASVLHTGRVCADRTVCAMRYDQVHFANRNRPFQIVSDRSCPCAAPIAGMAAPVAPPPPHAMPGIIKLPLQPMVRDRHARVFGSGRHRAWAIPCCATGNRAKTGQRPISC